MSAQHSKSLMEQLADQDEELYKTVNELTPSSAADSDEKRTSFSQPLDSFLQKLSGASLEITNIDERSWLANTAAKWQKVLSALGIPKSIKIHDPTKPLQPPPSPSNYLKEQEIEGILQTKAYTLSRDRLSAHAEMLTEHLNDRQNIEKMAENLEILKTLINFGHPASEAKNDFHTASIEFTIDILEGRLDFVRNIHPDSYYRLEREWLDDAKRLLAHRVWLGRGRGWGEREKEADYLQICDNFSQTLCGPSQKASLSDFAPVEEYIHEKYLGDGSFSLRKKRTKNLIRTKAQRLHDAGVGGDQKSDWSHACRYVEIFYGHIMDVIEQPDPSKAVKIFNMLTGVEEGHLGPVMVNMFEATIFRYFVRYS